MTALPARTHPGTYPATTAGVSAALDALGTTPGQVAERLHAGRFFGEPGEAHDCPIARYLHAVLTGTVGVSVGESTVAIGRTAGRPTTVYLPDPVRRFIAAFDLGGYRLLLPEVEED